VFSVGYPIQAALGRAVTLRREHGLRPDNVTGIVVRLPEDGARIVDNSAMPDVNLQHLIAVALIDGTVSFEMSHSRERMNDPAVKAVRSRVQLVADRSLMESRGAAQRARRGDAAGWQHREPLHAACARHEGESPRCRDTQRQGAGPHRAGPGRPAGRGDNRAVNALDDVRDIRELVAS
jgi:2-methylcitrate dehydratase PrpD